MLKIEQNKQFPKTYIHISNRRFIILENTFGSVNYVVCIISARAFDLMWKYVLSITRQISYYIIVFNSFNSIVADRFKICQWSRWTKTLINTYTQFIIDVIDNETDKKTKQPYNLFWIPLPIKWKKLQFSVTYLFRRYRRNQHDPFILTHIWSWYKNLIFSSFAIQSQKVDLHLLFFFLGSSFPFLAAAKSACLCGV